MNEIVSTDSPTVLLQDEIRSRIYTIRGAQVMIDSDLAMLYHVETRVFNQAVKRNEERFPENFRFQLTGDEHRVLLSRTAEGQVPVVGLQWWGCLMIDDFMAEG